MAIYNGSNKINKLYIGGQKIKRAYLGSTLVFANFETRDLTFTASGSIQMPELIKSLSVIAVGGGGGAGGDGYYHGNSWTGGGGASGAYCAKTYTATELSGIKGQLISYTVGAGGVALAGAQVNDLGNGIICHWGQKGGDTSFLSMFAGGGYGGNPGHDRALGGAPPSGAGGTATGGDVNTNGSVAPSNIAAGSLYDGYGAGGTNNGYSAAKNNGSAGILKITITGAW